jgi:hypothetical protein
MISWFILTKENTKTFTQRTQKADASLFFVLFALPFLCALCGFASFAAPRRSLIPYSRQLL